MNILQVGFISFKHPAIQSTILQLLEGILNLEIVRESKYLVC